MRHPTNKQLAELETGHPVESVYQRRVKLGVAPRGRVGDRYVRRRPPDPVPARLVVQLRPKRVHRPLDRPDQPVQLRVAEAEVRPIHPLDQ
jgi:hypothetical protein